MKILLSTNMTGQNTRKAFDAFRTHDMLQSFHTKLGFPEGGIMSFLSRFSCFCILKRRMYPKDAKPFIVSHWKSEILFLLLNKLKIRKIFPVYCTVEKENKIYEKEVVKYLRKHHEEIDAVYAYEGGAYYTFMAAKEYGIKCIYELPIGYWKEKLKVYQSLSKEYPEWTNTISKISAVSEFGSKKDSELKMADLIIVPSEFVKNTLKSAPEEIVQPIIVPYGAPELKQSAVNCPLNLDGKIKVLYCGSLTQRKGLANVFSVCKRLCTKVDLTVIGRGNISECKVIEDNLKFCSYIPSVSNDRLLEIMRECDVFFFPSFFEGFALVVLEAMSQGLPVITTSITSGPIRDGYDGWIVPTGDEETMVNLLTRLYRNRDEITKCSQNAIQTARSNSWILYQDELVKIINRECEKSYI